jgi:tetratricopeptide (TPR) repeat protein
MLTNKNAVRDVGACGSGGSGERPIGGARPASRAWPRAALPDWKRRIGSVLALITLAAGIGCQPAGPKALILGEKYINQGEYEKALRHLTRASVLIPEQPQVWNHLGLAYHGLNQPVKAADAYQRALRIDRDQAPPRYNLGVLYLEQGHLPQAVAELGAFVSLRTNSGAGYVKLGTALLRQKRPDEAEKALTQALRIDPKDPEAYNLLGLSHVQRKRPREAMQAFDNALRVSPAYAPVVLNQAVVAHQYFANKEVALERYKIFLETKPDGQTARRVQQAINSIEKEISGTQLAGSSESETNQFATFFKTNLAVRPETKTNLPPTHTPTNVIAHAPGTPTNLVSAAVTNIAAGKTKTNVPPATSSQTNLQVAVAATNKPANSVEKTQSEEEPLAVEVVRVDDVPAFTAPRDLTDTKLAIAQPGATPTTVTQDTKPLLLPRKDRKEEPKSGLFSKVNPANWFRGDEKAEKPERPRETKTVATAPAPRPSYPPVIKQPDPTPEPPRVMPRYQYRKKIPLTAGNRAAAEKIFRQGAQAHQQRKLTEAMELYRTATILDPSYFEAHYNLGLAAFQMKNLPLALAENELAAAAKPASVDARYNFALTLREANYPADAARELETIVSANPDEARAHFALANLYAEQLDQPALARRHYLAVLELNPAHAEAPVIRQWLATHP